MCDCVCVCTYVSLCMYVCVIRDWITPERYTRFLEKEIAYKRSPGWLDAIILSKLNIYHVHIVFIQITSTFNNLVI